MKPVQRILVGYDGSEPSKHAISAAAEMAAAYDAGVTICTASDHIVMPDGRKVRGTNADDAHEVVQHGAQLAREAGVSGPETRVNLLAPANALAMEARNGEFDLVVLGHRGSSGLQTIVMGSVAKALVEKVECSVLVVR